MSRRSMVFSQLGSSFRSELDSEAKVLASEGIGVCGLLTLLPPGNSSFDRLFSDDEVSDTGTPSCATLPAPFYSHNQASSQRQFSAVHQQVMRELHQETGPPSECSTCTTCDTCSTDTWDALGLVAARVRHISPEPLPANLERQLTESMRKLSVGRLPLTRPSQPREHDNMSGLWNMLATYDEFVVTTPGFNLYQQERPHWLDQEPIPWEDRERARRKCVRWLANCPSLP